MSPRAYLDHAATTPVRPHVVQAMADELGRVGNPSSLHAAGRAARRRVEEHRERIAAALGARPSEVVFTGSGTESDNLAVKGLYWARRGADPRRRRVLISAVEHHAVLDPATWLAESQGAVVELLAVDDLGRVHADTVEEALARDPESVAFVSVMWANNEVGTTQPIGDIAARTRRFGVPLHVDAVQAVGQLPVHFAASGADAMTVSAHKIGGPTGVAALLARPDLEITPLLHGGGQERDIRSGTVHAAAIAGFAEAVVVAVAEQPDRRAMLADLRDELVDRVLQAVPEARLNGDPLPTGRLPGNAHLSFPGCEADALLMLLDARGVECSTGSACSSGVPEPSHVLLAMGLGVDLARSSLRFSLGHTSARADVDALVAALPSAVARAQLAGRLTVRGA
jgi:cysteine desulfurase